MSYILLWREYNLNGVMENQGWEFCSNEKEVERYIKEFDDTAFEVWIINIREGEMMTADDFKLSQWEYNE